MVPLFWSEARGVLAAGIVVLASCSFDGSGALVAADARVDSDGPTPAVDAAVAVDAAPAFCQADDPDLVACWEFEVDVDADQPHDGSQYANHGSATQVDFVAGLRGFALSASPGSVVRVPDSESLDLREQFAIELAVYPRTLPVIGRAGLLDDDGQYGVFLHAGGEVRCVTGFASVGGVTIPADAWTQLSCVYDGTRITLYRDGAVGAEADASGELNRAGTAGVALGHNSPAGDPFDGLIDSVRVWRTPRTPSDATAR